MSGFASQTGGYKLLTTSANISAYPCKTVGIFVASASATPTITIYDSASTGTTTKIVDTFTPVSATWYTIPVSTSAGLYIAVGGTVSATVVYA
jgi:hypothetical protein